MLSMMFFGMAAMVGIYWGFSYKALRLPTVAELHAAQERDAYFAQGMAEVERFLAPYAPQHEQRKMCPFCQTHTLFKMLDNGLEVCQACGAAHDPLMHWEVM